MIIIFIIHKTILYQHYRNLDNCPTLILKITLNKKINNSTDSLITPHIKDQSELIRQVITFKTIHKRHKKTAHQSIDTLTPLKAHQFNLLNRNYFMKDRYRPQRAAAIRQVSLAKPSSMRCDSAERHCRAIMRECEYHVVSFTCV